MRPVLFADDPQFWFETLRTMGHATYGGADIAEVLTTAQNIVAGDYDAGTTSGWPQQTGSPPKRKPSWPQGTDQRP